MKIVFMGSPKGAADLLNEISTQRKNDTLMCVTTPDKPVGRGQKIVESFVAKEANKLSIPVLKPVNIKDENFLTTIKEFSPDLIVVVAYGKILPKELLNIPKYGCINVHFSLLPKYRGPSPIQTALLNGDSKTGITIMRMNEKLDEGDIILQEEVDILPQENAEKLTERLYQKSKVILLKAIEQIESGLAKYTPQDHLLATYTKIIKKSDGFIDLESYSSEKICNAVRAFTPWPGVFVKYKDKMIKILESEVISDISFNGKSGQIVSIQKDRGIVVKTKDGAILIKEVQPENSKNMSAYSFANGYRIKEGEFFYSVKK